MKQEKFMKLSVTDYIELKREFKNYILNKQKLFSEDTDKLPTFRQLCKRFNLTLDQVEQLCGDVENCNVNVGRGVSAGMALLERWEWIVEILL